MRYALNTVAINGNQTLYGYGNAAIVLSATGYTNKQKNGVSTAALSEVLAEAAPKVAKTSISIVRIDIDAVGTLLKGTKASSTAVVMTLDGHYGIPDPLIPSGEMVQNHQSRIVKVQKDDREFDVFAESQFP